MENKLELTEREYFELQSREAVEQKLNLEIELEKAKMEIDRKNIAIYGYIVDNLRRAMQDKESKIQSKHVALENVKLDKGKIREQIRERLDIPEGTEFGYNPETYEIIID